MFIKDHLSIKMSIIVFVSSLSILFAAPEQISTKMGTGARYVTSDDGVLRMYVNIWGHVNTPGRIMVNEGIDLATLFSLTGGPKKGANLKEIRIYREYPDKNGLVMHTVNFSEFIKSGDRSNFITIQPNDTFIIKQTLWSYMIDEVGTLNTIMHLINIYLNLSNLISSSK